MIKFFTCFLAGVLTAFSPCILPIIPIVVANALSRSKKSLYLLCFGMWFSYTVIGFSIASFGNFLSMGDKTLRFGSCFIMIALGLTFLFQSSVKMTRLSNFSHKFNYESPISSLVLGFLLGIIWTPCTGPILAYAISIASSQEWGTGLVLISVFGLGAVVPIILTSLGFKFLFIRTTLLKHQKKATLVYSCLLLSLGILILTGYDRVIEGVMVDQMPEWLIDLSTKY